MASCQHPAPDGFGQLDRRVKQRLHRCPGQGRCCPCSHYGRGKGCWHGRSRRHQEFRQSVSDRCSPRRFDQQHFGPEASEQPACMFGQWVCDLHYSHTLEQQVRSFGHERVAEVRAATAASSWLRYRSGIGNLKIRAAFNPRISARSASVRWPIVRSIAWALWGQLPS